MEYNLDLCGTDSHYKDELQAGKPKLYTIHKLSITYILFQIILSTQGSIVETEKILKHIQMVYNLELWDTDWSC